MFSFNSKMVWGGNILKYGHEISRKAIVKKITSEQHVFQNISSWILPNAVWLKLPRSISSFDLSCKQPWVAREMPKQPSVVYFNLFWVVFGTQFISNVFFGGKTFKNHLKNHFDFKCVAVIKSGWILSPFTHWRSGIREWIRASRGL